MIGRNTVTTNTGKRSADDISKKDENEFAKWLKEFNIVDIWGDYQVPADTMLTLYHFHKAATMGLLFYLENEGEEEMTEDEKVSSS